MSENTDGMGQMEVIRKLYAASNGDREALLRVVGAALPRVRSTLDEAHGTVQSYEQHEWDRENVRELALEQPEKIPDDQAIGAIRDIYQAVLRVLGLTPAAMVAGPQEFEEMNEMWQDAVLALLLKLHNPVIRYGLIGAIEDKETRHQVDKYLDLIGREVWGTALALTEEGDVNPDDFPPDVSAFLEEVAKEAEATPEDVERERQSGD